MRFALPVLGLLVLSAAASAQDEPDEAIFPGSGAAGVAFDVYNDAVVFAGRAVVFPAVIDLQGSLDGETLTAAVSLPFSRGAGLVPSLRGVRTVGVGAFYDQTPLFNVSENTTSNYGPMFVAGYGLMFGPAELFLDSRIGVDVSPETEEEREFSLSRLHIGFAGGLRVYPF
jgi:hypothetical protein